MFVVFVFVGFVFVFVFFGFGFVFVIIIFFFLMLNTLYIQVKGLTILFLFFEKQKKTFFLTHLVSHRCKLNYRLAIKLLPTTESLDSRRLPSLESALAASLWAKD